LAHPLLLPLHNKLDPDPHLPHLPPPLSLPQLQSTHRNQHPTTFLQKLRPEKLGLPPPNHLPLKVNLMVKKVTKMTTIVKKRKAKLIPMLLLLPLRLLM
jgi:hypothetical protein